MKLEGRILKLHCQCLRPGALLRRLADDSSIVLTYLISFPAFVVLWLLAASCEPLGQDDVCFVDESEAADDSVAVAVSKDTVITRLELCVVGTAGGVDELSEMVDALDVFVYEERGTRELESHFKVGVDEMVLDGGRKCLLVESGSKGPRTVVVVVNCSRTFNVKALARMDSMELLEYDFSEDDPSMPLMSGSVVINPGDSAVVTLRPLMCEVVLNSVSNGLDDYELLEEPSVRLCDMTPSARVLQFQEFRPKEVISQGALFKLPCDVGFYTQMPRISLWCYPNDTPETTLGAPHTSMEFMCRMLGEDRVISIPLPPLPRASRTLVDLTVNDEYNIVYKFTQSDPAGEP